MQTCPSCQELVREEFDVCPFCSHPIKSNSESTSGWPNELTYSVPRARPGCVTAAAIVMGLSAISPAIKGLGILFNDSRGEEIILPLAYYWGDVLLSLVLAWGLWRLKNWARILVIVILSLAILVGFALAGGAGIVLLLIFGYIIYWFAAHGEYFSSLQTSDPEAEQRPRQWAGASDQDWRTPVGYVIGAIGIILGLLGTRSLLGDSNALGLYFGILPAVALGAVAWGLLKA